MPLKMGGLNGGPDRMTLSGLNVGALMVGLNVVHPVFLSLDKKMLRVSIIRCALEIQGCDVIKHFIKKRTFIQEWFFL